jgi:hypothetical protein
MAHRQRRALNVRLSPDSGGKADIAGGPKGANSGSAANSFADRA